MHGAIISVFLVLVLLLLCVCQASGPSQPSASPASAGMESPSAVTNSTLVTYRDGSYTYTGPKDQEGYYVKAGMVIQDGKIVSMEWQILDSHRNDQVFDDRYEKVYIGNELYIQQCRENMKGLVGFVPQLLQVQDPDQVDAVSGATWVYDKFQEAAKALLGQAQAK